MKYLALAALVSACFCSHGGEIADAYSKLPRPNVSLTNLAPGPLYMTNHGIAEIGIERGWCYGTCPIYTLILKKRWHLQVQGGKVCRESRSVHWHDPRLQIQPTR